MSSERDPNKIMEEEIRRSFSSDTGPLWRVKMTKSKIIPLNQKDPDDEFVHSSNFIFSFHHGITDGSTSFRICAGFLTILSDVISGNERPSYKHLFGKFSEGVETERLIQQRKEYLSLHPEIYNKVKADISELANQQLILTDIFPVSEVSCNITKHLVKDMNVEDTNKLLNKFKFYGVTVHAGFTALFNWALIEMFIENGFSGKYLDMTAFHVINIRRFWKENYTYFPQGNHIGPMRIKVKTEREVGKQFWAYAQKIHKLMKMYIAEQKSLDEIIVYPLVSSSGSSDFRDLFQNPPPLLTYFSTTNMGDVSAILPETYPEVKVEWVTRSTSCHQMNIAMVHMLQTFNGKLLYGLDYTTQYVREDVAKMYVKKIFEKVFHLIST